MWTLLVPIVAWQLGSIPIFFEETWHRGKGHDGLSFWNHCVLGQDRGRPHGSGVTCRVIMVISPPKSLGYSMISYDLT